MYFHAKPKLALNANSVICAEMKNRDLALQKKPNKKPNADSLLYIYHISIKLAGFSKQIFSASFSAFFTASQDPKH